MEVQVFLQYGRRLGQDGSPSGEQRRRRWWSGLHTRTGPIYHTLVMSVGLRATYEGFSDQAPFTRLFRSWLALHRLQDVPSPPEQTPEFWGLPALRRAVAG